MPRKKLRLFVWEDVLVDYTSGIMFALAHDVDEARAEILKHTNYVNEYDLAREPTHVVDEPRGWALYGGG